MSKRVFDQQFHYGVFYAFVKLREQVRPLSRPLPLRSVCHTSRRRCAT